MQANKSRVINKLALVLISIVVLELVLIGDQVQPVKAIKKKILLKKLKKVLPLLALVKPKKKIILLPIPIPMFNKQPGQHQYQTYGGGSTPVGRPMVMDGSNQMPFIVGHDAPPPGQMMTPMMSQVMPTYDSMMMSQPAPQSFSMMMPSMTMTIENSAPTMPTFEMSTTTANSQPAANMSQSGALFQQQQIQQFDQYDENSFEAQQQPGGEYYYSSPWSSDNSRRPLASPAKLLRGQERFKPNQQQQQRPRQQPPRSPALQTNSDQQQHHQQTVTLVTPVVLPRNNRLVQQQQQQQSANSQRPMVPVLVIKNQWRPTTGRQVSNGKSNMDTSARQAATTSTEQPPKYQEKARFQQEPNEYEELIPVGPPRLMPIYQTPNGQLHMTPPTGERQQQQQSPPAKRPHDDSFDHEREQQPPAGQANPQHSNQTNNNLDSAAEVQTVPPNESPFGPHQPADSMANNQLNEPTEPPATSRPAQSKTPDNHQLIKGRQQQQPPPPAKRKPIGGGGY